jgi:hypothetical protein
LGAYALAKIAEEDAAGLVLDASSHAQNPIANPMDKKTSSDNGLLLLANSTMPGNSSQPI